MNDEYVESDAMEGDIPRGGGSNDGLQRSIMMPQSTSQGSNSRCQWFWVTVRFCNTFAVTILAVCVVWIFFQLQYITINLKLESDRLDKLLTEIQENETKQIEKLDEKVESNHSLTLYQMSGTFALLTCLLTGYHMFSHIKKYNQPIVQRRIITILWFSPIYSITSFLSLLFPSTDGYLAVIRDFYEAYTIYTFLALLIAILGRGDRDAVVSVLARHADHLKKPTNCLKAYYHPPPESSDEAKANAVLYECQVLAMQFVFIRPLTSIASFVATAVTQDHDDSSGWSFFKSSNFYIAMITNISVFLAFTGLLKFYHAVREDLAWCQPMAKFISIKAIVFLTFWQSLLISIFVALHKSNESEDDNSNNGKKSAQETAHEIQSILICLEMLFFSIAHLCVFPAEEWQPNYRRKEFRAPTMGMGDFAKDVSYVLNAKKRRQAQNSMDNNDNEIGGDDLALTPNEEEDLETPMQGDPLATTSSSYQKIETQMSADNTLQ